jgi:pSer/pThr/pTyr-binding forkhead associated (FHA) protein
LRILRFIAEKPRDAQEIAAETGTSYENAKKHIDKLLSIGVVRKEAGISSETSQGVRLVWRYALVPGGMEAITRTLSLFSARPSAFMDTPLRDRLAGVRDQVSVAFFNRQAAIVVLGGPADGRLLLLQGPETRIGRFDPDHPPAGDHPGEVVLPEEYRAVTRVTRPHGWFRKEELAWYYTDCTSTGGSFLNSRRLLAGEAVLLQDGDLLELGKGEGGIRLLLVVPYMTGKGERR